MTQLGTAAQVPPQDVDRACSFRLAVLAAMAAAVLPWRFTLRAFSTAVTPATHARRPSPHIGETTSKSGRQMRRQALPPRTEKMAVDQDWPSVYPVAVLFKPSAVPLPVPMGYPVKKGVPMAKEGNLELLKIPNFLHLTPVAIKKHCQALKDFCTEWLAALDSDEKYAKHFPIEIDTADYVSSGPSVRNPKARGVTLRVKLSSLNLDDHAKKKLIKLVEERYCKTTDVLTIKTDRCPLKRQNYDYALYLLTVSYHESWKAEEWEKNKTEIDIDEYIWKNTSSEKNILETLLQISIAEKKRRSK